MSVLRGIWNFIKKEKNESMENINMCWSFIRGSLASMSSSGSYLCIATNVSSVAWLSVFIYKMCPFLRYTLLKLTLFSYSSALLSSAFGKSHFFKDNGGILARLFVKNISEIECLSVW